MSMSRWTGETLTSTATATTTSTDAEPQNHRYRAPATFWLLDTAQARSVRGEQSGVMEERAAALLVDAIEDTESKRATPTNSTTGI